MQEISNHEKSKRNLGKIMSCNYSSNIENFKSTLNAIDWSDIDTADNVDAAYDIFLNKFTEAYNTAFPFIHKKVKLYYNNHKSWITSGISKSIHHKHFLYKSYLIHKSDELNN